MIKLQATLPINFVRWAWISLLVTGLTACIHIEERDPRFYIDMQSHLHEGMNDMAGEVAYLTELSTAELSSGEQAPVSHSQHDVLNALERIELIAEKLGEPGVVTNYSVINRYMGAFLYDVRLAKEFAEQSPPNYYPAFTLIKSCLSCHDFL